MTVVHGQVRPVFIVVNDRKIDEESEDPRSQEVPEGRGDQEVQRPLIGKVLAFIFDRFILHHPQHNEAHQRNRFHRRKQGSPCQPVGWSSEPEEVMRRPDDSRQEHDRRGKVRDGQGGFGGDEPHGDKQDSDGGNPEELEDALDPEVHDEPSPVIGHGHMGPPAVKEAEAEKGHHKDSAQYIEPDQRIELILVPHLQMRHDGAIYDQEPGNQAR